MLQAPHRFSSAGDLSLLPELENAFLHEDADVSTAAAEAIGSLGPVAVPMLAPHRPSPQRGFRKRAITAPNKIGEPAGEKVLADGVLELL